MEDLQLLKGKNFAYVSTLMKDGSPQVTPTWVDIENRENTTITDPDSGEIICSNCGMVISDKIDDTIHQERRASTLEEADKRARTGVPSSLARHDMGLSTIIGRENRDASGQIIDTAMHSKIGRLRTWDFRTRMRKSGDRNLMKAFEQLDRLKEKLGLSDTIVEDS